MCLQCRASHSNNLKSVIVGRKKQNNSGVKSKIRKFKTKMTRIIIIDFQTSIGKKKKRKKKKKKERD